MESRSPCASPRSWMRLNSPIRSSGSTTGNESTRMCLDGGTAAVWQLLPARVPLLTSEQPVFGPALTFTDVPLSWLGGRRSRLLERDVEDQADDVSDLGEHKSTDIASHSVDPSDRDTSDVLTLCGRRAFQRVALISFDHNLRPESADCGRQRHDVDDVGSGVEDSLCRHYHGRMSKPCLPAGWRAKVEFDDATRGQHRATRLRSTWAKQRAQRRFDPGQDGVLRAPPSHRPWRRACSRAASVLGG